MPTFTKRWSDCDILQSGGDKLVTKNSVTFLTTLLEAEEISPPPPLTFVLRKHINLNNIFFQYVIDVICHLVENVVHCL